ncbi:tumor suppressor candidate 3, variant 2 [Entomophthora muscae]|uniref:Tumor suppressor candidate 3, variant 2 n=1 Tax=Entomophthora muscae TaxID=34485 RepID=A0ACC2U0R8_9FUNG|nr:tumor suppressor candidate 3, variant 2 [Entomophthora muscae]
MRFFNSNSLTAALGLATFLGNFFVSSLSTKTKNEIMLASEGGMVQPTDKLFNEMLKGPRKHSLFVQFTVLGGSFDCKICHIVNGVLKEASKAVQKSTHSEDVYLVTLDYSISSKIFQKYKITSAPILYFFPATEKATESPEFLEFKGVGPNLEADIVLQYIQENLGIKIPYSKPINYQKLGINLATAASVIFVAYMIFSRLSVVANSTKSWASAFLVKQVKIFITELLGFYFNYDFWSDVEFHKKSQLR